MTTIDSFRGAFRFLSNFYPVNIYMGGQIYPSVEHAFQAAKTVDQLDRDEIRWEHLASAAKSRGRSLHLREGWDLYRVEIMESLVFQKFSLYIDLRTQLVNTGDSTLVEGNTWKDTFWGVCKGVGQNHLGKILMRVRECLRQ